MFYNFILIGGIRQTMTMSEMHVFKQNISDFLKHYNIRDFTSSQSSVVITLVLHTGDPGSIPDGGIQFVIVVDG